MLIARCFKLSNTKSTARRVLKLQDGDYTLKLCVSAVFSFDASQRRTTFLTLFQKYASNSLLFNPLLCKLCFFFLFLFQPMPDNCGSFQGPIELHLSVSKPICLTAEFICQLLSLDCVCGLKQSGRRCREMSLFSIHRSSSPTKIRRAC